MFGCGAECQLMEAGRAAVIRNIGALGKALAAQQRRPVLFSESRALYLGLHASQIHVRWDMER